MAFDRGSFTRWTSLVIIAGCVTQPARAAAQHGHSHEQEPTHHPGLHFSHPLVTESVSPDTKGRVDAVRTWETEGSETELELEGEYALHRAFSIELGLPYTVLDPEGSSSVSALGNLEVTFKFANYAFEDSGLLLGYGVELGVPTGDPAKGIGSDHIWEVEPFLNVGYKRGPLELIGFTIFGIPFNQAAGEEVETELVYNTSGLLHVSPRLQAILEINGATVLSGEESGESVVLLSPGVKVAPVADTPLFVGVGASVPLTDEELDARARVALFYHF